MKLICYTGNIQNICRGDSRYIKDIEFDRWIFGKTLNTKKFEYRINHNIPLWFRDWKYGEYKDDTFTIDKVKNVIDCGFANFMVDFINIQQLAKYLDKIKINDSFGIINQKIK